MSIQTKAIEPYLSSWLITEVKRQVELLCLNKLFVVSGSYISFTTFTGPNIEINISGFKFQLIRRIEFTCSEKEIDSNLVKQLMSKYILVFHKHFSGNYDNFLVLPYGTDPFNFLIVGYCDY